MIRAAAAALAMSLVSAAASWEAGAQGAARVGRVVTDTLWAAALGTHKAVRVYLPPSYDAQPTRRFPAVYYLHGWTGDERNWVDAGRLNIVADSLADRRGPEMIVVMPDGDDSWYTTWNTLENLAACRRDTVRTEPASSYCVAWPHYDDYIAHDVVSHVDRRYRTLAERAHRGIAGLSMGGFGAITIALNHPGVFAAAASHSGVLAPGYPAGDTAGTVADRAAQLLKLQSSYGAIWPSLRLAFGHDSTSWRARDPARIVRRAVRLRSTLPALYVDVGVQDRFLQQNRAFRTELSALGVPHAYRELPGGHDWVYWRANLPSSLLWLGSVVGK